MSLPDHSAAAAASSSASGSAGGSSGQNHSAMHGSSARLEANAHAGAPPGGRSGGHGGSGGPKGPIGLVLRLFSSVWLGIVLLTLLFVYSSVGSAGAPVGPGMLHWPFILNPDAWVAVRQLRPFELTEFEWFHWWPFKLLIALICTNLVVATLRRIPFNIVNLGVWMIHTGIIILSLGSVWYFSEKVEGDAPVNRRRLVIELPGQAPVGITALPGNSIVVGQGTEAYAFQVQSIDPNWEIRSGDDTGKTAFAVSVQVQSKGGNFTRQLLAGYPQYTEDVMRTADPKQPMQRAIKAIGKPLVDEALKLTLEYAPQDHFFLMDSRAVYLRELDAVTGRPKTGWVQRPIHGLPRYNDYISAAEDAWLAPGEAALPIDPVRDATAPPVEKDDPLPGVTFDITRYLRYANLETRRRPNPEGPLNPVASVRVQTPPPQAQVQQFQLIAFDAENNAALQGNLVFAWMDSQQALDRLRTRTDPMIRFKAAATGKEIEIPITETMTENPELAFAPIEGTEYSFRVKNYQDGLAIGSKTTSVAIIELRKGEKAWQRWVFDGSLESRDMAFTEGMEQHTADIPLDAALESVYVPGSRPPAPVMVLAGPGEQDLSVMITKATGQPNWRPVKEGETVPVAAGVTLTVDRYAPRTVSETKPLVVPREQRDRQMNEMASMIKLDIPAGGSGRGGEAQSVWLPYHLFAFNGPEEVLRRFPYRPSVVALADGRRIEMMFSRERLPLPAKVALEDFVVDSTIGGFTGSTSSITDWKSMVRFSKPDGGWTDPMKVSVNKPAEFEGYWFFQAQWDPPDMQPRFAGDPGSRGLNYTVLGVGNRHGVNVQLAGACIAVLGMLYAFYAKPVIKRRRQHAVLQRIEAGEFGAKAKERAHAHAAQVQVHDKAHAGPGEKVQS